MGLEPSHLVEITESMPMHTDASMERLVAPGRIARPHIDDFGTGFLELFAALSDRLPRKIDKAQATISTRRARVRYYECYRKLL
jgi:EAL domain-containing protein (putative c-di-GMP-specific phosphodiesterase class I)